MNKKSGVHEIQIDGKKCYLKFSVNTFIRLREDTQNGSDVVAGLQTGDPAAFCKLILASHNEATRLGLNKKDLKDIWEAGDILDCLAEKDLSAMTDVMFESNFLSQGLAKMKQQPARSEKKKLKKQSSK